MGTCVKCQSTTEYRCKICGGYICPTCRTISENANKDRSKGAMCSVVSQMADTLQGLLDDKINQEVIMTPDLNEFPDPQ